MKRFFNLAFRVAVCAAIALPMLTSCFDDSEIWDSINKIEHRLDSLENSLNEQLQALESLIDSKTTISDYKQNKDGSYQVTLSNSTKFTVLADGADFSKLVSIIEINGKNYWATYDEDGKPVVMKDAAGNNVPVSKETHIETVVEDGKYYISIDGEMYMTGYDTEEIVQVFTSCVPHKDATGNVYAMTFTYGEGIEITVAVDGYNGVIFRLPDSIGSATVITEYFISYGTKQAIQLDMEGVVDYVMQIPDGWRVEERTDEYDGKTYLDITAPAIATVEAEAAVAEGDLKIVAVVEGGKAAVSKLTVSAEPFKVFDISGTRAVVEPYKGVQKYAYGIKFTEEYDEAALLEEVNELMDSTADLPAGYGITETGINTTLKEILGEELDVKIGYTFWALPILYSEEFEYYTKEGMFRSYSLTPVSVTIDEPVTELFEAQISIKVEGTDSYYAGTAVKSDDLFDNILYSINNGIIDPVTEPMEYQGPASAFPNESANEGLEILPGTDYVTWIVAVEKDENAVTKAAKTYTEDDISYIEFHTTDITSGGSVEVVAGDPAVKMNAIDIPVTAEGAELMYYTYFDDDMGDWYSTASNDEKVALILKDAGCKMIRGDKGNAKVERIKPSSKYWLYIVAAGEDGKHGEVKMVTATTTSLTYNTLTVTATVPMLSSHGVEFKIETTNGTPVEYIYWFGKETDPFWANSSYLGQNKFSGQEYMAIYPDDQNILKAMGNYGPIGEDGMLSIDGINPNTNYILMVLAQNEEGLYSKACYKKITTLSVDLGDIRRTGTDAWNAAKEQVKIEWIENEFHKAANTQMPAAYSFNFSCPTNYTAYIICSTQEYYDDPAYFITNEDKIIDIESYASRRYDSGIVAFDKNGDMAVEPDWYNDNGVLTNGHLMNICDFYIHGVPSRGFATYFASGSHNGDNCIAWENDTCSNYARALKMIEDRTTLEGWKNHFRDAKGMTNEKYIAMNAEIYLEAYAPYYEGAKPIYFENKGEALKVTHRDAVGPDDVGNVIDDVVVVLKDIDGNYFEPMFFPVPNLFD